MKIPEHRCWVRMCRCGHRLERHGNGPRGVCWTGNCWCLAFTEDKTVLLKLLRQLDREPA